MNPKTIISKTWRIIFITLSIFIVFGIYANNANAKIPVFFDFGGEVIAKIADFPDKPPFKTSDGHFFDAGVIYKQINIFWLPIWNYDVRWCGFINEVDKFVEMNRKELEQYAQLAHISLPENIEIPFEDQYGGKLMLALLAILIGFGIYMNKKKNIEE